ncbi:hypothetical protein J2X57_001971 [Luteibacter sp. 1214]|uniref:head completion/stabilization protein n=1 Tax=Luteibacter sp. 1214 TaxID=2817735 RepID=UPI00285E3DE4|nr:head completion/stabilization protein [Luteibacter sp. 1214]MDR6642759.1 hypothetical protein [Luteibacter sp. 1214]
MSSLIANGGAAPGSNPAPEPPVGNDGFWPDIDVAQLRAASRLTGNVTPERLRAATIDAVLSVNQELAVYRARMRAEGWEHAADIGETIAGARALVHRYQRAVTSTVQASLAESYRDWDNTRAGDFRADFESVAADDFRRNARWAISDILGVGRCTVELI